MDSNDRDRLTTALTEVAQERQPTAHSKVGLLEGQDGLYRLRVGELRAILELDRPYLRVLHVGNRSAVYRSIDDITERRAST